MRFGLAVLALLALQAAVQIGSIRQESQTWDEGIHLAAGYSYWRTGDFRMNPEHPPFTKLWCALPLLWMDVRLPADESAWRARDELNFGALFLYTNRLSADAILFPARCMTIVLTLALGLAIALWTRSQFGTAAALIALTLYVFDPNVIAHGRYVTSDLGVTLFSFLACVAWGHPLLAGVCLGLALGSKFSAVFLIPVFAVYIWKRRPALSDVAVMIATALAVLAALYQGHLTLFWAGITQQLAHNAGGHQSYLFGNISQHGWWYYFPAAFAVKWPVAVLILIACAVWIRPPKRAWFLTLPLAVYAAICLTSQIDIGVRHLLPLIPFLYILLAVTVPRRLALAALILLGCESLSVYPDYLAFFNRLAGGPSQGPRYLLDSNIDWGQDTLKLKHWLNQRGIHSVCRVYFGQAILAHYGIEEQPLPGIEEPDAIRNLDCIAAVSVTPLYGLYVPGDRYRWLRARTPVAKVGYSIYVYDLRKQQSPPAALIR